MNRKIIAVFGGQGLTGKDMAEDALADPLFGEILREHYKEMDEATREEIAPSFPSVEEIRVMDGDFQAKPSHTHAVAYATNAGMFESFKQLADDRDIAVSVRAASGQSLGQYSAAQALGMLPFEYGRWAVATRGRVQDDWKSLLNREVNEKDVSYVLVWDSKIPAEYALVAAEDVAQQMGVYVTGQNGTRLITVTGLEGNMKKALTHFGPQGATKAIGPLNTGAPFHSELMEGSAEEYELAITSPQAPLLEYTRTSRGDLISDSSGKPMSNYSFVEGAAAHIVNPTNFALTLDQLAEIANKENATMIAFSNREATTAVSKWARNTLGKNHNLQQVYDRPSAEKTIEYLLQTA